MSNTYTFEDFSKDVVEEIERSNKKHGDFASVMEAYAILLEEVQEFWASVKKDKPDSAELIQVAAMAVKCACSLKKDTYDHFLKLVTRFLGQPYFESLTIHSGYELFTMVSLEMTDFLVTIRSEKPHIGDLACLVAVTYRGMLYLKSLKQS